MLRALAYAAPILLLDWLLIAFIGVYSANGWWEPIAVGLVFGSLFGQTTLAATWSAFGSPRPLWRVLGSLFWIVMLSVGLAINARVNGGPRSEAIVFGAITFSQWLLLQLLLWSIRLAFGVQMRHVQDEEFAYDPSQQQFGIRQLMIITTVVGVALGIGRLVIPRLIDQTYFPGHDLPILAFLVVAEVVLTLPLVLAALLRRYAVGGTVVALAFVALVTFGEVPLLRLFAAGPTGPETTDFIAVNAVASTMVLLVLTVIRLNGYSLVTIRRSAKG